jgi:tetratricopeptide (TPR) repeat protein
MAQSARLPGTSSRGLWILGPWQDWLLFIGTPALILPLVSLAQMRVRIEDLVFFVASFGALGHHFPGLLRAYGDRELFDRFKVRFVVAPLFLVAVCVFCVSQDFSGLTLVAYAWGVWHGLGQTYGFLRIYDAKVRSSARLTCRLDLAMCVVWFCGLVVLSPTRLHRVLELFYASGGPVVPAAWLRSGRALALLALVGVTLAFLVNLLVGWRRGQKPSPLKLFTMLTSFGFWWYAGIAVSNLLLGNLLFELFHDVQYLSIVWVFNRSRAGKGALSGLSRFLFRPRAALIVGYVGLVFAYGAVNYVTNGMAGGLPQKVMQGALVASALLHFYYDGFIWKVSDKATGQSLGLSGGKEASRAVRLPGGLTHPLKWLLFLVPLAGLAVAQTRGLAPDLERSRSFAQGIGAANDHSLLGQSLLAAGDWPGAALSFRAALERDPALATARAGLGDALSILGDRAAAEEAYRRALQDEDIATARNSLGNLLAVEGRAQEAVAEYRRALELDPKLHAARANLGGALASLGQWEEAQEQLRVAVKGCQECPDFALQYQGLARALYRAGRPEEALEALRKAVVLKPDDPELRLDLADLLATSGRSQDALEHYQASLLRHPEHAPSLVGLANTLALLGRFDEAKAGYRKALSVQPAFPQAHRNLGFLELQLGELAAAEASLRAALKLAPDDRDAHAALAEVLRRRGRMEEAAIHEAAAARPAQTR